MPNILIVDDEPGIRESLKGVLEEEGFSATLAESGEACLDVLRKHSFDAVLLDVWLPKMDGLEVLRKLRSQEKTRNIPVIILSNYDEEDLVARGLRLGAHEYLIKARTTPASLSEGIEDWLKE